MSFNRAAAMPSKMMWLFAASVSLSTTKFLLDRKMHYPMHLLWLQLAGSLLLRAVRKACDYLVGHSKNEEEPSTSPQTVSGTLALLVFAIPFSVAVVCAYEGLHHNTNVPLLVIILSLASSPCRLSVDSDKDSQKRLVDYIGMIARGSLALLSTTLMLLSDYRVSSTGGIVMTTSAVLLILAKSCVFALANVTSTQNQRTPSSPTLDASAGTYGLLGALLASGLWCIFRERSFWLHMGAYNPLAYNIDVLALNLISSSLAWELGDHIFNIWRQHKDDTQPRHPATANEHFLLSSALMALVALGSLVWPLRIPYTMSVWQWVGCVVLVVALATKPEFGFEPALPTAVENKTRSEHQEGDMSERETLLPSISKEAKAARWPTILGILLSMLASVAALNLQMRAGRPMWQPVLDNTFQSPTALDIVISRYHEPASDVAAHIQKLLQQPSLDYLKPRFNIYNKNIADGDSMFFLAEIDKLLNSTLPRPQIVVYTIPNIGREADTYLAHITTQWDSLANHTLFIQADPHAEPGVLERLQDYFNPSTGFLSLSYTHTANKGYCISCDDCYDRDWTEDPGLLHELYSDFNYGRQCSEMLLTYRGQFIASAARIRGNKRETYAKWLDELRNPNGKLHTPPYTTSRISHHPDFMDAPRVGFTFERMWSTIMQCNDRRIAERCPSLLTRTMSPIGNAPVAEDCQCLDQ